ncbi:MAG: hypothetical protein HFF50_05720 [Lawsonibacter sp.]|nr:hypothetical protein [Lawsonibacter sp.]
MKQMLGTFFELGGRAAMECLTRTGLDYVIIDTEHNCFSPEQVAHFIQTAENGNLLPYVRIGDTRRPYVLQMLDLGARGLIVPNITAVKEVKELVSYAKFPPLGDRGYCPNRTSGWGADTWAQDITSYMQECNRRCKLIPQCETKEALEQIEDIAAIPGVDGIFVGPCDLSIALGIPLQFDSPVLIAAIERILCACQANRKESIIFSGTIENAEMWLKKGFDSVTCGLDVSMLIQSYQNLVKTLGGTER